MKKILSLILIVLLVGLGVYYFKTRTTLVVKENQSSNIKHFVNADETIALDYNPLFSKSSGDTAPGLQWRLDPKEEGMLVAKVSIPRSYMPGTNFSEAWLTVGRSSDASAIKTCVISSDNETNKNQTTVSGFAFTKFISSGAGAGNFYETTSYRGIVDGDCYVVEYTIHSTNIGNYSPDQGIKEFNKVAIQNDLENIVKSVKFLVNSD